MMGLPFTAKPGDIPWINVGCKFSGAPTVQQSIAGDGNCYYRAISWIITGTQTHHIKVRKSICTYISSQENFEKMRVHILPFHRVKTSNTRQSGIPRGLLYTTPGKQYVQAKKMDVVGTYATQVEIWATAFMLGKDVFTWTGTQNMSPRWVKHFASGDCKKPTTRAIYLINLNEHFCVSLGPSTTD